MKSIVGGRFASKLSQVDLDGEVAGQFGDFGGMDHQAYAVHAGGGYTFDSECNTRLGLAYNFASGDDDPTDGDHETFDNLFPTNHAHYGYMDFFSWQNMHNLEGTINSTIKEKVAIRLAYQGFWLAEEDSDAWYNAGLGTVRPAAGTDVDPYVGSEIDVTAKYTVPLLNDTKLALLAGYSHFFTGDYVDDTGSNEDADFVFLQGRVAF